MLIFQLFFLDSAEQKYIAVVVLRVGDDEEGGGKQIPKGGRDASAPLLWVVFKGVLTMTSLHCAVIVSTVYASKTRIGRASNSEETLDLQP